MKAWKKLSLLLCLTFSFSTAATACGEITGAVSSLLGGDSTESSVDLGSSDESSTDYSSTPTPETPETPEDPGENPGENPGDNPGENPGETPSGDPSEVGAALDTLADKVASGVEGVQSLKVDFDFDFLADGDEAVGNEDEEASIYGTAIVTTANVGVNMQLNLTMENAEGKEEEVLYYYENYLYMYGLDSNGDPVLERAPESLDVMLDNAIHMGTNGQYDLQAIGAMVEEIVLAFAEVEIPEFTLSDIWAATYVDGLVTESTVTDESISVSIDRAAIVDDMISTFDELTMNSSLSDVINCVLAKVDPELTVAVICEELAKLGPVEMNDVAAAIEEATGMTLQDIWDAVLADETVYAALVEAYGKDDVDAMKAFDVEEFLNTPVAEGETKTYGEITFDDLVILATEGEVGSVMLLVGAIQSQLNTTKLSDIDDENHTVAMILTIVQAVDCTQMKTTVDATFGSEGALTEFVWEEAYVFTVEQQGTVYLTAEIKVSELSQDPVEITIPEGWEQEYWHCGCAKGCEKEDSTVKYNKDALAYLCPDCADCYICPVCNEQVTDNNYTCNGEGIYHHDCYETMMKNESTVE